MATATEADGSGDQLTQPKDEWGRDAQIYLAQIKAERIEAEVEAAVMATRVSVSTDEPITERLLQYSSNPQKVGIVLSKLLRWAKKKPDIRMQTSLMTSEESRYADILIALKFSKLKLPDSVAQTVKSRSVKVSLPKALLSEISQFISIFGIM